MNLQHGRDWHKLTWMDGGYLQETKIGHIAGRNEELGGGGE